MPQIDVNLPGAAHSITIECGLLSRLGSLVREVAPHAKAMLAIDSHILETHGRIAEQSLRYAGYEVTTHLLKAEESHKTLEAVQHVYDAMLSSRLERASPVIALGGGITGDTAGFAAATYLRGMPLVQVPTTLLAMVDASIGGKTGVNVQSPGGELIKNMVGAFWQPRAVLIDPHVLRTLDARHFRCGLAECVKHGMIADAPLIEFISANAEPIAGLDMDALTELITRSAAIKAGIIQRDERESGDRALLNLGHTFGHAIETIPELGLHHGEAVAIGIVAAIKCSMETSRMTGQEMQEIYQLLKKLGLPVRLGSPVSSERIRHAMGFDKKVRDGRLRLILPAGIGRAEVVSDVPQDIVDTALLEIGARR